METFTSILNRLKLFWVYILLVITAGLVIIPAVYAEEIKLDVTLIGGGTSIDFGTLKNLTSDGTNVPAAASRQVRLTITPVGKKPYIVTQILHQDPNNEGGELLRPHSIRYRVNQEMGSGIVRTPNITPLSTGSQEIFISDSMGSPAILLIIYDFLVPPGQEAGTYNTLITYRADKT